MSYCCVSVVCQIFLFSPFKTYHPTRNANHPITSLSALFKGGGPLRDSAMVVGSAIRCPYTGNAINSIYTRTLCSVYNPHIQMSFVPNKCTVIVVNIQIIPLLFHESCVKITTVTKIALLEGAIGCKGFHIFYLS